MRWLPLLLLCACGPDRSAPPGQTCLATVTYRYLLSTDTLSTGGAVAPEGGPLCIELAGAEAIITNGDALYIRLALNSGSSGLQLLWPSDTRAVADLFRKDGHLYLAAREGSLRWLALPGVVIRDLGRGRLVVEYHDADEDFVAEFVP